MGNHCMKYACVNDGALQKLQKLVLTQNNAELAEKKSTMSISSYLDTALRLLMLVLLHRTIKGVD